MATRVGVFGASIICALSGYLALSPMLPRSAAPERHPGAMQEDSDSQGGVLPRNGEGGIRTRETGVNPSDGLANRWFQPLTHLSSKADGRLIRGVRTVKYGASGPE